MTSSVSSILGGLAKGGFFRFLDRYFYPELLMVALYAVLWVDPEALGDKGYIGLSVGLWMEFVMAHGKVALGVVGFIFPANKTSGKLAIGCASVFYLLFVGGLCWVTGNIITAVAFIVLCAKRIGGYHSNDVLGKEIAISFGKAMWMVVAGGLGFLIGSVFPAPIENLPGEKGAEMVPAWGIVYFLGLHLLQQNLPKWMARHEQKKASGKR